MTTDAVPGSPGYGIRRFSQATNQSPYGSQLQNGLSQFATF